MATQVQRRRGNTAQNDAFLGALGELAFNTELIGLRLHDGVTVGGHRIAMFSDIATRVAKSGDTMTGDLEVGVLHLDTDGSAIFGALVSQLSIATTGVISFPDNVRQTFNPGANNAGLNVGAVAGDPSTPSNGDLWYDSTANELTARINGVNVALGGGSAPPFVDTTNIVMGSADATKLLRFEIDGFTAATTRVLTPQNADYIIAGTNVSNSFSVNQILGAQILLANGTNSAPAYTFSADSSFGLYRAGNSLSFGWAGADLVVFANGIIDIRSNVGALRFGTAQDLRVVRSAAGVMLLDNGAGDFTRLQFGGTTASFPSLKRSTTGLQFRLADDSAYTFADALEYRASGTKVVGAQGAAVADASGGTVIDVEARTALNALLARLRTHGLIAT